MSLPAIVGYPVVWGVRVRSTAETCVVQPLSLTVAERVSVTVAHTLPLEVASPPTFREDSVGMLATVRLANTSLARLLIDAMSDGQFQSMSYTYTPARMEFLDEGVTEITRGTLHEICVTHWPRQRQAVCRLTHQPAWRPDPFAFSRLHQLIRQHEARQSA